MSNKRNAKHYFTLQQMVEKLEAFAPISLAESWDNVGLLIEPTNPRLITKALVVNDLTESVMENAIKKSVELIISYHPPIFTPLNRITQSHWKERIVGKCIENNIALYSPHTAWDSVNTGVNDWLCRCVMGNINDFIYSIEPIIANANHPNAGAGRIIRYVGEECYRLNDLKHNMYTWTDINHMQLALGCKQNMDSKIKTIAVCAGAGSSVLKGVCADLYLTGEMSHHDVLDAVHRNTSVILLNHSNSTRGFLEGFVFNFMQGQNLSLNTNGDGCYTRLILDKDNDKDLLVHSSSEHSTCEE